MGGVSLVPYESSEPYRLLNIWPFKKKKNLFLFSCHANRCLDARTSIHTTRFMELCPVCDKTIWIDLELACGDRPPRSTF